MMKMLGVILSTCTEFQNNTLLSIGDKCELKFVNNLSELFKTVNKFCLDFAVLDGCFTHYSNEFLSVFDENGAFPLKAIILCDVKEESNQENVFNTVSNKLSEEFKFAEIKIFKSLYKNKLSTKKQEAINEVSSFLFDLGFSNKHIGTHYLKSAIEYVCENGNVGSYSKNVYPLVARQYMTSGENLEKNIRNAIQKTCERMGKTKFEELLQTTFVDSIYPSSKEFVSTVASFFPKENKNKLKPAS